MPKSQSDQRSPHPTPREVSNAVEVVGNVHYLIEKNLDEPAAIMKLLSIAEESMETLRTMALTGQLWESGKILDRSGQEYGHANLEPGAVTGEEADADRRVE